MVGRKNFSDIDRVEDTPEEHSIFVVTARTESFAPDGIVDENTNIHHLP